MMFKGGHWKLHHAPLNSSFLTLNSFLQFALRYCFNYLATNTYFHIWLKYPRNLRKT